MENIEKSQKFQNFIEQRYYAELLEKVRKAEKFIVFDFSLLSEFDPELAEDLLEEPEDTVSAAEHALGQFDLQGDVKAFKIRFRNLPVSQKIMVRNIRSNHISKLLWMDGIVRQKSDVRPQVVNTRFECPACGTITTVLQLDNKFREPTRCGCGRKGRFRLVGKELVDAQSLTLEEAPEDLEGGEQPKRIKVFLKNDLVSPISEKKTNPGTKILVVGQVKESPIILKTGGQSTRFDISIEANYVEAVHEEFISLDISDEEIQEIKNLSQDPKLYSRLVNSIAPSIYGHDAIKEALLYQLMGGVRKIRDDGVMTRGDMHILLIGDPGCIAGDSQVALINKGMEKIRNLGDRHLQPIREVVTKIRRHGKDKYYDFATRFHHYENQPVLKVRLETGKEVICTFNQPFLTEDGWKRADEIPAGTKIRVMPKIPNNVKKYAPARFTRVEETSGGLKRVALPEEFTPSLASLCGYIVGDGHIHKRGYAVACYVNQEEEDLIGRIVDLWLDTFNIVPSIVTKESSEKVKTIDDGSGLLRQIFTKQKMHLIEVNSRQVAQSLLFLSNKRVPQQIFRSPNEVVARFISWVFEADGCVFGNGRGRTSVQLKSRNNGLLKDVQLLLLYFGIQSRIVEDNLCIRRCRDIRLFAKHIGFVSEKKRGRLRQALQSIEGRSWAQVRKRPQRYERVAEIIPAGAMDVYDLEVPVSNMFIANGIVCHNSGKSQLLKRITNVAPKARYVSGKGTSGAGLTASVVRDEFLQGYSLEAGALVLANRGIVMIDELDKMSKEDRGAMHEALEQQSFHYDTIIQFADGGESKIGDFVESLLKEHSGKVIQGKDCLILKMGSFEKNIITTDWSTIFSTKIDRVSKHVAPSEFIEITAANGRKIVVTPEHPTFCIDNAQIITKRADEITTASWIPTPLQIPIAGEQQQFSVKQEDIYNPLASQHIAVPVHNDKAFFKIIGYVLAEGSKERNRGKLIGVNFTNKDKHVLNDFKICMKEFFGISPYIQERKDDSEPRWMLRYISRELAEFLKETVPEMLEASAKKTIPEIAMKGTKDNIAAMLSCMFEGDGHVSKKQRTIRVGFGSNSRRMCEQVQDLLLRFSIRSNLTEHKKSYKISITGYDNLLRFDRYIGFRTDSKNQIVREYLDKTNFCIIRTVKDVIPNCQEELIGLLKKYGQSIVRHNKLATMKHDYLVKGKNISRKLLQKAVEQLESVTKPEDFDKVVNLRKLAWAEIGFERVRRVRRIRNETQKWVYDVTIDPNHAFVSQNMILHNTVSISKANIQATLRAETTVLAAANPKFGRFDPYGNIADQIDLPSTLINRFDLIFPIKDLPDAQKDDRMAEFILNLHQNPNAEQPEVATKMIRKYIAYAKQNVKPQLTEAANEEIKAYYLKMRASGAQEGAVKSIPISPRQLEGLIRLSEAVARVRLSDKVTKKDAKRAVRLLDYCLRQIAMDEETGTIDIDRIATGIPATQRSRIMIIKEIISDLENKLGNKIPVEDIIRMATEKGIDESEVDSVIEKLKRSGDVFEPRHGLISKL